MEKQKALYEYVLRLADDSLILGHRVSEWCGHGPILEEDIALTNLALDLIGQATSLLNYAGELEGKGRDGDALAFLRYEREYKNLLLVEQMNGDFGKTIMRQFLFDAFRKPLFEKLQHSTDQHLAAIAEKSLKETKYHLKHTSEWVIRLGDGTEESHNRIQESLDALWKYTNEIFYKDDVDSVLIRATTCCRAQPALRAAAMALAAAAAEAPRIDVPGTYDAPALYHAFVHVFRGFRP